MNLLKIGRWSVVAGAVMLVVGLVGGIGLMILGQADIGLRLLSLTPVGALLGFGGVTLVVMTEPRDDKR